MIITSLVMENRNKHSESVFVMCAFHLAHTEMPQMIPESPSTGVPFIIFGLRFV